MFRRFSTPSEDSYKDIAPRSDYESRKERWGSTIAKMEASFATSVKNDASMVPFRGGSAAALAARNDHMTVAPGLANDYFSVLSAPGTSFQANSVARVAARPYAISRTNFSEWVKLQKAKATGEVLETRRYFEKAVCLMNSLVLKVVVTAVNDGKAEYEVGVDPKLITAENLMVHHNFDEGDVAHLIQTETEDDSNLGELEKKYGAMKALGIVAYELLMRGDGPPISSFLPSTVTDKQGNAQLLLSIDGYDDSVKDQGSSRGPTKRSRVADGDKFGICPAMIKAGVPYPLCRFTIDLLGGECSDGLLFRSDSSFQSFAEILSDLKQMMQNPEAFVHLSVKDQWRLAFGDKCHGRETEKKLIMEVASRVTGSKSNDALFEALALLMPKNNKQQVVMVTGQPGAGKSRLVMETQKSLENQGWVFLGCKFDRIIHSEPLSIISSAFDEFLKQCYGQLQEKKIRAKLNELMQPHDISILAKHVPMLTKYTDRLLLPPKDFKVCKEQIHELFSQLLEVLSATSPLALFLDDFHWADPASIALFHALTKASEPGLSTTGSDESKKPRVMFIGTYRNTELDTNPQLVQMLDEMGSNSSVEVTDIVVGGFDINTLNGILSESLCVPMRRTKALSEIILQKTEGIIIHIIEFIGRLTVERILCHSFVKGWEWSTEVIESCQISESVAELLTFKLKNLPADALLALQVCSIFGIQIEEHIINFIKDFDRTVSVDIIAGLKVALESGIVEMAGPAVFKFVHDLVLQAAFEMIKEDERSPLLQKLALALIRNATAAGEIDAVIYLAVDLIRRIRNDTITDPEERILYASLNEKAGKLALAVPDFGSAVRYTECGLSFLCENHWDVEYELSMQLFTTSIAALYACTDSNQKILKERINQVFQHSTSLEDEYPTRYVWIRMLGTTSLNEAIRECHVLLERLGEPIDPSKTDLSFACSELKRVKDLFSDKKEELSQTCMVDPNKLKAMKIMSSLMAYYHHAMTNGDALVCTRMVEMSMRWGYCEDSLFGVATFGAMLVCNLGDVEEGCKWARMVLSVMSRSRHSINVLLPAVYSVVYGFAVVVKEPFQATLDCILQGCRCGLDHGNIQFGLINARMYATRMYHCGKSIGELLNLIEAMALKGAQYGQKPFVQNYLTPIYNIFRFLAGLDEQALAPLDIFISNDDLRDRTKNGADYLCYEAHLMFEIISSFLFRNMDKAQGMADMIMGSEESRRRPVFNFIIIDFYVGLTACYFARRGDENRRIKARNVRDRLEGLVEHSKWNWENKSLLLEAEVHYTDGEINEAARCYDASIASAKNHKFVQEEAVACELAAYFYKDLGDETKSMLMFKQAHSAYMKWGAFQKASFIPLPQGQS